MILNVIRLNALITKAGWMNGLKNMTNLYAAYKTLQIKRHIRTERYYMQMEIKKAQAAILTSEKNGCSNKNRIKKRRTLHYHTGIIPRRQYNICKCLYTQHKSI